MIRRHKIGAFHKKRNTVDLKIKRRSDGIFFLHQFEQALSLYEFHGEEVNVDPGVRRHVDVIRPHDVWMIESGNLNGKCADLNALYVAMARSVGLPARDLYGIRVVPSEFGYKALGAGSEVVTKAQHCRAEVWLSGSGWTPVDPADVRKVVLEEPPTNLAMTDLKVMAARRALFGAWEGNWLAFNDAHDVVLPGSNAEALPFLMYPQAIDKSGFVDPYDVDAFKYRITARELTA